VQKQSGGLFLARGKVHGAGNAPDRVWEQIHFVSKNSESTLVFHEKRKTGGFLCFSVILADLQLFLLFCRAKGAFLYAGIPLEN
jgi:hypothetical protein